MNQDIPSARNITIDNNTLEVVPHISLKSAQLCGVLCVAQSWTRQEIWQSIRRHVTPGETSVGIQESDPKHQYEGYLACALITLLYGSEIWPIHAKKHA